MSEPGLNYKVTVSGASQGAAEIDRVAKAAGKVSEAAGKAAPQAKSLGEAISSLGSRNNAAKDVLEGVTTAAQGGSGAVFGLTKAFRAFRELLNGGFAALGPGGILVGGLGVLVGLLPKVWDLMNTGKKSAADLSEQTKKAANAISELGKLKLDGMVSQLEATKKAGEETLETLKLLHEQAQKIDDAQKALEKARVEADASLSVEQKGEQFRQIDEKYAATAAARQQNSEKAQLDKAAEYARAAQTAETEAAGAFNASYSRREAIDKPRTEINQQIVALNTELRQALSEAKKRGDADAALNASEQYKAKVDPLVAKQAQLFSPTKNKEREEAIAQEEADRRQLDEANKRALAAAEAERKLRNQHKIGQDTREKVQAIEAEQKRVEAQAAAEKKLADARSRQGSASDREEFLSASKDVISAQENLGESRRAKPASKNPESINGNPLKEAATTISEGMEKNVNDSNEAIREGADAIRNAMSESVRPPDLGPLVQSVTEGFTDVKNVLSQMQQQIQQHSNAINQIRSQIANMRAAASGT